MMSFVAVGNLLEDTIKRSAKTQSHADGELAWLRKRLDNERRDPRSREKLALESDNMAFRKVPRALLKQAAAVGMTANKENAVLETSVGPRAATKVCFRMCACVFAYVCV